MTTIAATLTMMAADSKVVQGASSYNAHKLYRLPCGGVLGAAGHNEAIQMFLAWWPTHDPSKLRIPKRLDFEALVLTAQGLFVFDHRGPPDVIKDSVAAIGTGGENARLVLDTMIRLKRRPDPRIAVEIACKRRHDSGLPVESMRLRK